MHFILEGHFEYFDIPAIKKVFHVLCGVVLKNVPICVITVVFHNPCVAILAVFAETYCGTIIDRIAFTS